MHSKFSILKNLIWALCIVVCLLALFIGFIAASIPKYPGEQQDGILYLAERPEGSVPADFVPSQPAEDSEFDGSTAEQAAPAAALNKLPETEDAGQEYIDSLTFLCDSSLMGLKNYGLLSGGQGSTQYWGTEAGNLPANTVADPNIVNPADGVVMPVSMAAGLNQPAILVVSVGMDGLTQTNEQQFRSDLTALINGVRSQSPGTSIILCSPTAVANGYAGIDGITVDHCNQLKSWIEAVCAETGCYYADIARAVCDPSGMLLNEFASTNGKTITSEGLQNILMYLRTHKLG